MVHEPRPKILKLIVRNPVEVPLGEVHRVGVGLSLVAGPDDILLAEFHMGAICAGLCSHGESQIRKSLDSKIRKDRVSAVVIDRLRCSLSLIHLLFHLFFLLCSFFEPMRGWIPLPYIPDILRYIGQGRLCTSYFPEYNIGKYTNMVLAYHGNQSTRF